MSNLVEQQTEELAVFRLFMGVCGYPIVEKSIRSQSSPKPDIFCRLLTGVTVEFELTNGIDQQLAQKMNDCRIKDKGGFNNEDPIEKMILDKIKKFEDRKYDCSAERFELLVYLGLMPIFLYQQKTIVRFLERNRKFQGFDKIWVFRDDRENPQILWTIER